MGKFIKITDIELNAAAIIMVHRISGIAPHHKEGSIINGVDGSDWHVRESIEDIEAQLLRDEFAKGAMIGASADEDIKADVLARWSYLVADAMLKERRK